MIRKKNNKMTYFKEHEGKPNERTTSGRIMVNSSLEQRSNLMSDSDFVCYNTHDDSLSHNSTGFHSLLESQFGSACLRTDPTVEVQWSHTITHPGFLCLGL